MKSFWHKFDRQEKPMMKSIPETIRLIH